MALLGVTVVNISLGWPGCLLNKGEVLADITRVAFDDGDV